MTDLLLNKGINKPIEFKGLKAQYIGYLAVGLLALLIVFALMYVMGVPVIAGVIITALLGSGLFVTVFRFSHRYGAHGLMKATAWRQVPRAIVFRSRKVFIHLKKEDYA